MKLVILAMIAASFAVARAEPTPPDPDDGWEWEGDVGGGGGTIRLHHVGIGTGCLYASAGPRYVQFALRIEAAYCTATWPGDDTSAHGADVPTGSADGHMTDVAAVARYYFARPHSSDTEDLYLLGEFYVEAGVARQTFTWDAGGELSRPVAVLGIGGNELGRWATGKAGLTLGARLELAPRDATALPATCAGPCDQASRPSPYDRAVIFTAGGVFGGNPRRHATPAATGR